MMLLGQESNTSIWQKSAKLHGGNFSLRVGNPRFPLPLYEINVHMKLSSAQDVCHV